MKFIHRIVTQNVGHVNKDSEVLSSVSPVK